LRDDLKQTRLMLNSEGGRGILFIIHDEPVGGNAIGIDPQIIKSHAKIPEVKKENPA
jgi:hypothetical protein